MLYRDDPPPEPAASTPLAQSRHFELPASVAAGKKEEDGHGVPVVDPDFADLLGNDGDVDMGGHEDSGMMHILQHIGVEKRVAA